MYRQKTGDAQNQECKTTDQRQTKAQPPFRKVEASQGAIQMVAPLGRCVFGIVTGISLPSNELLSVFPLPALGFMFA
jgi:hypothetical protein